MDHLTSPPILGFPDYDKPFVLRTDASQDGLGSVLYQSWKLEFLTLQWGITKHFRDYLYYTPEFTGYTDNNRLTYVPTTAQLNATGHRWVAELADFRFTIKYRPGHSSSDADALSS